VERLPLLISWFRRWSVRRDGEEVDCATSRRPEGARARLEEQNPRTERIDWEKVRREHGLSEGQKLYVGEYEPGRLGGRTWVWVDGKPLNGQFFLSYGFEDEVEIATLDDVLAEYDPAIFGGELDDPFDTEEIYRRMVIHNKYDPTTDLGEQELALNVLVDLFGEAKALRHYEAFAEEIANDLSHELWSLPEDRVREWVGRKEWAARKRRP
jgi:hypothetical protein